MRCRTDRGKVEEVVLGSKKEEEDRRARVEKEAVNVEAEWNGRREKRVSWGENWLKYRQSNEPVQSQTRCSPEMGEKEDGSRSATLVSTRPQN